MPNKKTETKPAHKTMPVIIALVVFVVGILAVIVWGPNTGDDQQTGQPSDTGSFKTETIEGFTQLRDKAEDDATRLSYEKSLASSYSDSGDYQSAIELYLKIIEKSDDPRDVDILAQLYLVSGDQESADKYFAQALEEYERDPDKYEEEILLINGESVDVYEE